MNGTEEQSSAAVAPDKVPRYPEYATPICCGKPVLSTHKSGTGQFCALSRTRQGRGLFYANFSEVPDDSEENVSMDVPFREANIASGVCTVESLGNASSSCCVHRRLVVYEDSAISRATRTCHMRRKRSVPRRRSVATGANRNGEGRRHRHEVERGKWVGRSWTILGIHK